MGMTGEGECNKKELNEERQIEIIWQLLKSYHPCPSGGVVCDPSAWKNLNTHLLPPAKCKCCAFPLLAPPKRLEYNR